MNASDISENGGTNGSNYVTAATNASVNTTELHSLLEKVKEIFKEKKPFRLAVLQYLKYGQCLVATETVGDWGGFKNIKIKRTDKALSWLAFVEGRVQKWDVTQKTKDYFEPHKNVTEQVKAELIFPIKLGNKVIAVLALDWTEYVYPKKEAEIKSVENLLEENVPKIVSELYNFQLIDWIEELNEKFRNGQLALNNLDSVIGELKEHFSAKSAAIFLLDQRKGLPRCISQTGGNFPEAPDCDSFTKIATDVQQENGKNTGYVLKESDYGGSEFKHLEDFIDKAADVTLIAPIVISGSSHNEMIGLISLGKNNAQESLARQHFVDLEGIYFVGRRIGVWRQEMIRKNLEKEFQRFTAKLSVAKSHHEAYKILYHHLHKCVGDVDIALYKKSKRVIYKKSKRLIYGNIELVYLPYVGETHKKEPWALKWIKSVGSSEIDCSLLLVQGKEELGYLQLERPSDDKSTLEHTFKEHAKNVSLLALLRIKELETENIESCKNKMHKSLNETHQNLSMDYSTMSRELTELTELFSKQIVGYVCQIVQSNFPAEIPSEPEKTFLNRNLVGKLFPQESPKNKNQSEEPETQDADSGERFFDDACKQKVKQNGRKVLVEDKDKATFFLVPIFQKTQRSNDQQVEQQQDEHQSDENQQEPEDEIFLILALEENQFYQMDYPIMEELRQSIQEDFDNLIFKPLQDREHLNNVESDLRTMLAPVVHAHGPEKEIVNRIFTNVDDSIKQIAMATAPEINLAKQQLGSAKEGLELLKKHYEFLEDIMQDAANTTSGSFIIKQQIELANKMNQDIFSGVEADRVKEQYCDNMGDLKKTKEVNKGHLRAVLYLLLKNSYEIAKQHSSVKIEIKTEVCNEAKGRRLKITIKNDLPNQQTKPKGMGTSLTICRRFVNNWGGDWKKTENENEFKIDFFVPVSDDC